MIAAASHGLPLMTPTACRCLLLRATWALAMLAMLALPGCASRAPGLDINTEFKAVSQDSRVLFIVLHYTVGSFPSALKTLTQGPVSSHYLVDQDPPTVYRLVDEGQRAWHAGPSAWQGLTGLNASSIGIEIVNAGFLDSAQGPYQAYPDAQIDRVVALVRDIAQRHRVRPHRIVGHSDIAPQVKQDPGPMFPWRRLHEAGLVPWPDLAAVATHQAAFELQLPDAGWFQDKLLAHGFALARSGEFDTATRRVLSAFQMKYRPSRYDGLADAQTAALLQVISAPGGLLMFDPATGERRPYAQP